MHTLLAELLQMLGGPLQLLRPLLASLLQRPAVLFNALEQVIQSQRQHPQVEDGHSSSLWRCGLSTWQGRTVGLQPESHQEHGQLQDSSSAHREETLGAQRAAPQLGSSGWYLSNCKEVNPRRSSESPGALLWRRSAVRMRGAREQPHGEGRSSLDCFSVYL